MGELTERNEKQIIVETPQLKVHLDETKSVNEQAKDIVGVMATQKAIEDEQLADKVTKFKKEEILENATANLKNEKAENKQADKKLQECDFGIYQGVANCAGIKKSLPKNMQKILFTILGFFQIIVWLLFGVPTSILNIVMDCVDTIVGKLSSIARSAKVLVLSLITLCGIALAIYIVITFLRKFGIINF